MRKLYSKPTVMLGLFWAFMFGFILNTQASELNRPNAISVIAFAPTNGVVGNTITVVGSDLSGVTVTFAGGIVAPILSNNGFALTVQVPTGAVSGPLVISRGAESVTTTTSFTILAVPSYCVPSHTAGCVGNSVGRARILTTPVNFTNTCASTNGPSYTVLSPSSNTTTTLTAAQSYTIEITPSGTANSAIGFWGDWNANGTFETTEYTSFGTGNPAGTLVSRSVTLPATVTPGLTAVRIRTSSGTINSGSACTAFTSGETVDFFVTLQASAPAPSITSFTPAGGRVGDVITVNGANLTGATFRFNGTVAVTNSNTGTQAQIVVPTGASSGRISVTTPGGTTVSNFDFTVFGATDYVMSTTAITSCVGTFYSPNSPGNYPNNSNITQVISPDVAGNQVRLDFTQFVLSAFGGPNPDRLQIFNGPTTASPALHSGTGFAGTRTPFSVQASNPTGQLTLVFISDNNNNAVGFTADLTCVEVTGPGISGFTPATGAVGTTVTITGFNFNVSPGLQVRFNGTLATVTANTDNSITVTVPIGATTGPITVTNGAGSATSTAGFTVPGANPTITSFTPNNGSIGSTVTITGTNLLPLTQVRFTAAFGPGANATVISNNGITLVVTVPNNAATGPITVVTAAGTVVSTASYTVNATPTITNFTASGAVGSQITVQGANFAPGGVEPTILINGIAATVVNFGGNFAQVTVPAGATTGLITVTTSVGTVNSSSNFIVLESPVISNFTPNNGAVGTQVTVTGSNLTGGTFSFNGTAATTLSNDGSTAVIVVPTGATNGFITVTSPNGSGTSNPRQFQVLVPPTITTFTPTSGPVGTVINITGTGFTGTTTFQINGVTAGGGPTTVTAARITVSAGTTTGPIRVSSANGATVTATDFTVTGLSPTITSFTPTSGPVGTTVTVNGTNFVSGTTVIYGGNPVATTLLTQSQLTFVIPAGATTGLIIVSNASGNALSPGNFTVTGGLTPTITSFTPISGSVGDVITINGTNFNLANTEVRFNGVLVTTLAVNSTTNIQVIVPAGATTGPITVTTPLGTGTSATNFTVVVPIPTITFFNPDQGGIGGTTTIFGSAFTGATSVTFNGTNALFVVNDDNTITATVPAGATSGLIRVTTVGGTAISFSPFTITTLPVISSVSPLSAVVGATVTLTGSNLTGATSVTLDGQAVTIISNTANQIQVRLPAGARSGFFEVTTPAGNAFGFDFFSVDVAPSITAIRPTTGNVGDIIEIDGEGLGTSTISINGIPTTLVGISANGVQVQVPIGATTGFITATNTVGTATSTSIFTVTNLRPNIISFTPTSGVENTLVTISGFNLGGVTSVRFGTIDALFFVVSGNSLQAVVPTGLTGSNLIFVDGVNGRDTSVQRFTITIPTFCGTPTITQPRLFPQTTNNSTLVAAGSAYSFKFFGSRDSVYIFSTCNSASGEDSFLRIYDRTGTTIINQSDDGGSYCSGLSASIEFTPTASDTFIVHLSRFSCGPLQTEQLLTYFKRAITALPVILNFEPASGLAGSTVEVSGANFTGATSVRVNGTVATFTPLGATRLQLVVPATATSGPISITNASGTGTSSTNFTVITATSPLVTFITPTSGATGSVITINGTNLGPNPQVFINGVAATNVSVDPTNTIIIATVADGTTTGTIRVTTVNGSFVTTDPFVVARTLPVIVAVTPNSGVVGATITITGSSLANPTSVSFNGTPAVVTASSNNSITVTVPTSATSGFISVGNEVGVGFSPTVFSVILPLPTIANFSPSAGSRGSSVTINGTNLSGSSVFFGSVSGIITSNTATQIQVTVPPTAITAPITVSTIAGTAVSGSNFTVILPPAITSISPLEGIPGDTITVTGTDLNGATNVALGATFVSNIVSNTGSQIRFIVPVGAVSAAVRVTTGFGTTASTETYTVIQAPQITGFTPSSGSVGTNVTIAGVNFLNSTIRFNGVLVTSSTILDNRISAQVPSGATTGFITVINRAGVATSTTPFIVNGVGPVITSFDPAQAAVGTNVLITGANFTGATNVLVGGTRVVATFSTISDSQIRFTVPAGTTDGPIIVFTPNGSDTSNTNFRVNTTLFGAACATTPFVNGGRIVPTTTQRTADAGSGFAYYYKFFANRDSAYMFSTCRSGVQSGGNDPFLRIYRASDVNTIVAQNDDNGLVCQSNLASLEFTATASDTFYVVLSRFQCFALSNGMLLDYQTRPIGLQPVIYDARPSAGEIGSTVTLTGINFNSATPTVTINEVVQTITGTLTTSRLSFIVTAGTTNGRIRVTNTNGADSTEFIFVVNPAGSPTITNFTPFTGLPGTTVTITGTNLASPTAVLFNGVPATVTASNTTTITVVVPGGAGTGPITITTATGSITTTTAFLYQYITPLIARFAPATGPVGTSVRVRGSNLGGLSAVSFNGIAATSISNASDTAFTVIVPATATTGAISAITPGGTALSGAPFTVIVNTPTIAAFTPASGIVGSQVTITGTNLDAASVFFGGIQATNIISNSSTSIVVVVPVGAQSGPITVTTTSGFATSGSSYTVTIPSITFNTPTGIPTRICAGSSATVSITVTGTPQAGNVFTVQGSNGTGSFATPFIIGSLTSSATGVITIPVSIPGTIRGTGFRYRVLCTAPTVTSGDNGTNILIDTVPNQPIVTTSGTTDLCPSGSVILTAPLATSYIWSNGATTRAITVSTAGTFTVRVINGLCTSNTSAPIAVNTFPNPGQPTITASGPLTFCSGNTVTLSAPSGAGSYLWSNGATTRSIDVSTSGSFTVVITNINGCASIASAASVVTVTGTPATPTISAGGSTVLCNGQTVTLNGPAGATAYAWSNGASTRNITVSASGNYSLIVTNAGGCPSASSNVINVSAGATPATPTVTTGGATTFCTGGSVTLTSSVGTAYLWSNGATTRAITVNASGNYSVQVSNASGCLSLASAGTAVTVNTLPTTPTITSTGSTVLCTGGSVTLTSTLGTSYIWSNGATTQSIVVSAAGNYTVATTNAAGCTSATSAATAVIVNTAPTTPSVSASGATTFCTGGSVTLTSTLGTSYLWSNGATTRAITVSATGNYSVAVTNAAGCTSATSSATSVTVNTLPTQPTITASGPTTFCSGGSVTLSATAGATSYLWSNGATTPNITVSTSGTFTVSVTNASGCTSVISASRAVVVNPTPAQPTVTVGGPTTFCAGGSVTLTAPAGFSSYAWSNGATTRAITATTSDSYSVVVGTAAGCTSVASASTVVTVNPVPTQPTISASGATTFCTGGSVTLTASAANAYLWSNGATTQSIVASTSGNYSLLAINATGCTSLVSTATTVTVNPIPTQPTISASGATTFCEGGSVTLTAPAGAATYIWSNGASSRSIVAAASGNYSVSIVSAAGCTSTVSMATAVTVNPVPTQPSVSAGGATTFCSGGSVTLTATGGTNYIWSNGATTPSITVTASGNYTASVVSLGCTSLASAPIAVVVNALPTRPTITAGGATTFCLGGTVTLTASTGTSYIWSNGATTQSITISASGSFTVAVTNAAGCTSQVSTATAVTVNALPTTPTIAASGSTTLCNGGSVTLTAPTAANYLWSTGATTASINVSAAGSYSVRTINVSGCTSAVSLATAVIVNPIPATPTITATGATTFCAGGSSTLETADVAGASYLWSNGSITRSIVATAAGNYSVQVISAEGCTSLASTATTITITAQPAAATISVIGTNSICAGDSVTLAGPVTSSAYSWSNGATTQTIRVGASGTYTLTLFNGSCSGTSASETITVLPRPATPVISASGPIVFCSGGDVILTATENTDGYLWSNGATTRSITVSASADLTVVLLGANGCNSLASAITQVRSIALPTTPTISARTATTFCEGNGVWLVGPAGLGAYSWSNGATTDSIFVTTSGSYTLQAGGGTCISTASNAISVTVNPIPSVPTITAGGATTFCVGGSVTLSAPAGASAYLWSNGATTETISVSTAGTYSAQVIGTNGCPSDSSNEIEVIVTPVTTTPVISAATASTFCEGGSVVLSAAQPADSYLWSTGETTATITVSNTSNISLVTIDTDACTSAVSNAIAVQVNPIPATLTATANGSTTICAGSSVELTATAGADAYLWSNGATTQTIVVNAAGNYSVVSISAAGCTSIGSNAVPVIVQPITPQPSITAGGPTTVCAGSTVTLTASAADAYLWSTGETTQSIVVSNTSSVSVITTNSGSCESIASASVDVNISAVPSAPVIAFTGSTGICSGETVTLVAPSGFANYVWSDGSTNDTLIAASAGDYSVQVGNNPVCLSPASAAVSITADPITPTPSITVTGDLAFCIGDSVVLTASEVADAYLWSNGATTRSITVFNAGAYTLSTSLAGACPSASSAGVDVVVNPLPTTPVVTTTGNTTLCSGETVTLDATAGFAAYLWSDGSTTQSITVNAVGDYSVFVANASGCVSAESNEVSVGLGTPSTTPTFTVSGPLTFCQGNSVVLTADAVATSYLWSNGATTRSITVTTAGTFSLQVLNLGSCISEASSAVTTVVTPALAAPSIIASGATTVCAGETVTLTAPAGFDTYVWSNGNNTQSITVNASGNYSVTVQNAGTCASLPSNEIAVVVNPISATPTISTSGVTTFCQGGSVTLTASSSTGSYLWSNGATTQSIVVSANGTFTVQVTDAASCISAASVPTTVVVNPLPTTPTITLTGNAGLCGTETAQLSATAGAVAYIWSNGATTQSITVSSAATYTVRAINAEGCTSAASAGQVITVLPITATPVITPNGATSFCAGGNVTLTAPLSASYLWNTGATTRAITVNTSGSFTVQTTATGSCISVPSASIAVTVNAIPDQPVVSVIGDVNFCQGGSVQLSAPTADAYLWSNGATTQNITVTASGNFSVAVISATGCTSIVSTPVAVIVTPTPAQPTITTSGSTAICNGSSVTLTASAATGNYLWSNGATTQAITVNTAGNYTVQVINGTCSSLVSLATAVTISPAPSAPTVTLTGSTTLCTGDSVVLTASVSEGYLWSNGATTRSITVRAAGSFTVQATTVAGCTSAVSSETSVTLNTTPTRPVVTPSAATTLCAGGSVILNAPAGFTSYTWSNGATTQSITVSTAGAYTVIVQNTGTCVSLPSLPINVTVAAVIPTPVITSVGPNTFCANQDSIVLTAPAGFAVYVWSNGSTNRSITVRSVSGSYSVRVGNGTCASASSVPVVVTANAVPNKPSINFAPGRRDSLVASVAGASYIWSIDNQIQTQTGRGIKITRNGTYTVIAVSGSGCRSIVSNGFAATPAKTVVDVTIQVYPNPFQNSLNLSMDNLKDDNIVVNVFDVVGKLVYTEVVAVTNGAVSKELSIGYLPAGSYQLQISTSAGVIQQKLMHNK